LKKWSITRRSELTVEVIRSISYYLREPGLYLNSVAWKCTFACQAQFSFATWLLRLPYCERPTCLPSTSDKTNVCRPARSERPLPDVQSQKTSWSLPYWILFPWKEHCKERGRVKKSISKLRKVTNRQFLPYCRSCPALPCLALRSCLAPANPVVRTPISSSRNNLAELHSPPLPCYSNCHFRAATNTLQATLTMPSSTA
jgi:hypothetical protein